MNVLVVVIIGLLLEDVWIEWAVIVAPDGIGTDPGRFWWNPERYEIGAPRAEIKVEGPGDIKVDIWAEIET